MGLVWLWLEVGGIDLGVGGFEKGPGVGRRGGGMTHGSRELWFGQACDIRLLSKISR